MKKRIFKIGCIGIIIMNLALTNPAVSYAAGQLNGKYGKTHVFVDTDLASCSVEFYGTLQEKYTTDGLNAMFYRRSICLYMKRWGNASKNVSVDITGISHVDASGNKLTTFKNWKKEDYIIDSTYEVVTCSYNDRQVKYSRKNGNKLKVTYVIGGSSFVGEAIQANSFQMSLNLYK